MKQPIVGVFGKLKRNHDGIVVGWHPLQDHMIDVAACFERLCGCHAIHHAMEETAGRALNERDIQRLAVLIFLHDIGKANSGFQAKRWEHVRNIPRNWPVQIHAGHGFEAIKLFIDAPAARKPLEPLIEQICAWGEASETLLKASISHHGRPIVDNPGDWSKKIWESGLGAYDPVATLSEIGEQARTLYPQAFESGGEPFPDTPMFGHLFAGLVQLADWLGSDTRFFPYSEASEDRAVTAKSCAQQAIAAIGLDVEDWRGKLNACVPTFVSAFGITTPRPIQTIMSDETLGPLVILESETGSGKTEAALWRYVHLFRAGLVDSLYFALPTRVAATQVYQRVAATIKRLWPENPPVVVRALPGYISADGVEATQFPNFEVLWADRPDDEKAHQRWAAESAKRFLAASVAVGTIDQALLGALQVRHAHLRYAMLTRSLLVVDEVHASDPYMTVLLERLLKTHLNSGGHALLLSATLGSSARSRYLALAPKLQRRQPESMPFGEACTVPYPAISDYRAIRAVKVAANPKKVVWTAFDIIDKPEQIARMVIEAANQGAKVLVIRNTVPDAIATFAAIENAIPDKTWLFSVNGIATLHHSRFSRQDRPAMDKAIEAQLGKQRPPGPCVVVGTQTLEQSLDIDADVLISDLCPMDVLLQRIGRLHRHNRPASERTEGFQSAQAWVLTPDGHDLNHLISRPRHGLGMFHNGGGIYADLRVVEATRGLLCERPEVSIPDDNRYLVEAATHPDKLHDIQDQYGEAWQKLGQKIEGDTGAQRTMGHLHALEVEKPFGEHPFPDDVQIATRLGAQDWIVEFSPPLPGPFGRLLKDLPIRHHLLPKDLPFDTQPTGIMQTGDSITFRLGDAHFRYSRLGLERFKDD